MDLFKKCEDFAELADSVRATGLYPFFKPMEGSSGSHVVYNGRRVLMTGSNNYLGLTDDPRVKEAVKEALERFGTAATGSRLLNGNSVLHDQLEQEFSRFLGKEAALVFSTGFLTNLGALSCLAEEGDFILSDAENHGSIIAGCKGSSAKTLTYRHNDMQDLERVLKGLPEEATKWIVSDGVFSMTGEMVNLPGLVAVKKSFPNSYLYIDDAHGIGVLGDHGRGTCDYFGLSHEVDLIMGTFSKAFASLGGVLTGPRKVIDYLRHHSRAFIFSAAMPPSSVAAVLKVLEIIQTEQELFDRLWQNVRYIRQGFQKMNLSYIESKTPILSIFVGDEGKTMQVVKALFDRDVFATPVMFPAVPYGQAIIRTSYMPSHTREDLDHLLKAMEEVAQRFGLLRDKVKGSGRAASYWNVDAILQPKKT